MIKISTHLSKKVPIPGTDYSSQQYGASMEIEIADADRPEAIQQRIRQLYGLLAKSVDEQIAAAGHPQDNDSAAHHDNGRPPPLSVPRPAVSQPHQRNGNGKVRGGSATQAQQRALWAICKQQGLDLGEVL